MEKRLHDFPQMVRPAEDAEGVKVVDMAAFAAGGGPGGEDGTGSERPAIQEAVPFLDY